MANDTVEIGRIDFIFNPLPTTITDPGKSNVVFIYFANKVRIPAISFKKGNVLWWLDGWNGWKRSYFFDDKFVVKDISVFSNGQHWGY